MERIKQILMTRDGMSEDEADQLIKEAKEDLYARLDNGEFPEGICEEWFGLEPDYLVQLLDV